MHPLPAGQQEEGHVQAPLPYVLVMAFSKRLVALRKQRGLTQAVLAKKAGVSVIQIKRYEAGNTDPSLEVIRALALSLGVTADELLFDKHERGPDEELRLQFEAVTKLDREDKKIIKAVLEALILKAEAKRWAAA
jgi:transcriptional regulator with XRE-family HTH domain